MSYQSHPTQMGYAVMQGDLALVKKLRSEGEDWTCYVEYFDCGLSVRYIELCEWASSYGKLDILKWARGNGCYWDRKECLQRSANHDKVNNWIRFGDPKPSRKNKEVDNLKKQVAKLTQQVESMGKNKRRPKKNSA